MISCERAQEFMIGALYGEIRAVEQTQFENHLQNCSECAAEYKSVQETLEVMDRHELPTLAQSYWRGYWDRLRQKLPENDTAIRSLKDWWQDFTESLRWQEKWAIRFATGVALLLIGFFLGRMYFPESGQAPLATSQESALPAIPAALEAETERYLERSKILLMGIMNIDAENEEEFLQNFSLQQGVSRELVQQANILTDRLDSPEHQQVVQLITELRTILIQIANLEEVQDFEEVELIQMGVKRKFVLFKINMRDLSRTPAKPQPDYSDYL